MIFHSVIRSDGFRLLDAWVLPGGTTFIRDRGVVSLAHSGYPGATPQGDVWAVAGDKVRRPVFRFLGNSSASISVATVNSKADLENATQIGSVSGFGFQPQAFPGLVTTVAITGQTQIGIPSLGSGGTLLPSVSFFTQSSALPLGDMIAPNLQRNAVSPIPGSQLSIFQSSYMAGMVYAAGCCSARLASFALLRVRHNPPLGVIGYSFDGQSVRAISDLTLGQVNTLAGQYQLKTPPALLVGGETESFTWEFLAPLGPAGDNEIEFTGIIRLNESYTRRPTTFEQRFFMGIHSNFFIQLLLDEPVTWIKPPRLEPIMIPVTRSTYIFVRGTIGIFGITSISPTGYSLSQAVLTMSSGIFGIPLDPRDTLANIFRRKGGGYDAYWWRHIGREPHLSHGFDLYRTFDYVPGWVSTPNGWFSPCRIPPGGLAGPYQSVPYNPGSGIVQELLRPPGFERWEVSATRRSNNPNIDGQFFFYRPPNTPWPNPADIPPLDADQIPFVVRHISSQIRGDHPPLVFTLNHSGPMRPVAANGHLGPLPSNFPSSNVSAWLGSLGTFNTHRHVIDGAVSYQSRSTAGIRPSAGSYAGAIIDDGADTLTRWFEIPVAGLRIRRFLRSSVSQISLNGGAWQASPLGELGGVTWTSQRLARLPVPNP